MACKERWDYRQKCEDILNKRDVFFQKLKAFEDKHGYVPQSYRLDEKLMIQYMRYKEVGSWKNDKKLVKKINRRQRKIDKRRV